VDSTIQLSYMWPFPALAIFLIINLAVYKVYKIMSEYLTAIWGVKLNCFILTRMVIYKPICRYQLPLNP
jgi:hypothetical protein